MAINNKPSDHLSMLLNHIASLFSLVSVFLVIISDHLSEQPIQNTDCNLKGQVLYLSDFCYRSLKDTSVFLKFLLEVPAENIIK
jgi:hypothetical protein